jgi:phenylacetate-coenzyme A ligase PaaK-like adenylate-forming protein
MIRVFRRKTLSMDEFETMLSDSTKEKMARNIVSIAYQNTDIVAMISALDLDNSKGLVCELIAKDKDMYIEHIYFELGEDMERCIELITLYKLSLDG